MYVQNRLRKRLAAGETSVGCWIHMCSPIGAEVVALAGFDVVIIDHEHGPSDFLNTISLMQAVSATQATPIMRVPWNDPVYIKRALDIGAQGIIIPAVESAEEARAAVAACRYHRRHAAGSVPRTWKVSPSTGLIHSMEAGRSQLVPWPDRCE